MSPTPETPEIVTDTAKVIGGGAIALMIWKGIGGFYRWVRGAKKEADSLTYDIVHPIVDKELRAHNDTHVDAHALAFSYRDGVIRESTNAITEEMRVIHAETMGAINALSARAEESRKASDDRISRLETRLEVEVTKLENRMTNVERRSGMETRHTDRRESA